MWSEYSVVASGLIPTSARWYSSSRTALVTVRYPSSWSIARTPEQM